MLIIVYLRGGGVDSLRLSPEQDPLDAIYEEFGYYAEFDIIREEA